MKIDGKQIIEAIVRRLNDENVRCYDSAIVAKLSSLDTYELNQLVTFGEIDKWLSERNDKARYNSKQPLRN
jgi:hypothetical protein